MDLFEKGNGNLTAPLPPLAARMRPVNLREFVGQEHIIGEGKLLRRAILADRVSSLILYGPPGCGKTALAMCIAAATRSHFARLNAVTSGVGELRQLIEEARHRLKTASRKTIVFIDEIHRFNKQQQDALIPDVEEGNIVLIGTTVMNPYFSVNSPIISRSIIFELEPLSDDNIKTIITRAFNDKERGLGNHKVRMDENALAHIVKNSSGDARRALNALELGVITTAPDEEGIINFTVETASESIQKKALLYDKDGDSHYDTISAFIKSMRGSDPDAAVYWLARMLTAGEDPMFIARRIAICAAEDVGNADPMALVVAGSAVQVSQFIGMPEAQIPLAQAAIYVACAPKSNASCTAISKAMEDVREKKILRVPGHLKDSSYPGAGKLGRGRGYKYPHDYGEHFVEQVYADGVSGRYYKPDGQGYEQEIIERINGWRKGIHKKKNAGSENITGQTGNSGKKQAGGG